MPYCGAHVGYACARHWVEGHRQPRAVFKFWAQASSRPCMTSSSSLCRTVDGASSQYIDRVVVLAVMLQRLVRTVSNCSLLDWLLTCPFCACPGRQHCRGAEVVSLGPVQQTTEIPQLQYIDKVVVVCCAGPTVRALSVGDSRDPTVAARFLPDQVVDMPVVFKDRCWVSKCRTLRRSSSCSTFDKVVDVLVGAGNRQDMDVL